MDLLRTLFGRPTDVYGVAVERAMAGLQQKTTEQNARFDLAGSSWSADLNEGELVFTAPDGTTARCSVQVVGTYDTTRGTWLWGWDHPSVPEHCARAAHAARAFGAEHGVDVLTTRQVSVSEDEAWHFAALACDLTHAAGAYRGPAGPTLVFMVYDDVRIERTDGDSETLAWPALGPVDALPADVMAAVHGFARDRHAWEVDAWAHRDDMDAARRTYAQLIERWCHPSVMPQPVSMGNHPLFAPGTWDLDSGGYDEQCARVRVWYRKAGMQHALELRWLRNAGEWRLLNLLLVEEDGTTWEGL